MKHEKVKNRKSGNSQLSVIEKLHPHKTILFFALLGSSLLFMSFSFLFLISISRQAPLQNFYLSKWFFTGTIALLISSYSLTGIKSAFQNDRHEIISRKLIFAILLGSIFIACQIAGWNELIQSGFLLNSHSVPAFFYLISGLHLIHALAGQVILAVMLFQTRRKTSDPVNSLIYFSNPLNLLKLELSATFWHFVDFLWVALFIMFLFTLG
jgi:cytochrome c oxidase subunit 3